MDITKLAMEKTSNSDQIIGYHQQAFQSFNQCLLQIQTVGIGMGIGMAVGDEVDMKTFLSPSQRQIYQP